MEAEISPCVDKNSKGARVGLSAADGNGVDNNSKKRRKSRVSFGNIQTTIFQKDSEWTSPSTSPSFGSSGTGTLAGRPTEFVTHITNLSALPDDTVFASPAGSVAMETTGVVANGVVFGSLPSLPQLADLSNDGSMASFGDHEVDQEQCTSAPISLMDLVADDEHWGQHEHFQPTRVNSFTSGMEFMNNFGGGLLVEADKVPSKDLGITPKPADVTDHDLTADIPAPGNRTRAFANHTGAFDVTGAYGGGRHGSDQTNTAGMELTTAFGGIVKKRPIDFSSTLADSTSAMEFTAAHGGIVRSYQAKEFPPRQVTSKVSLEFSKNCERDFRPAEADAVHELTGKLERIKGSTSVRLGDQGEPVAMDMTGTFGRILSAISSTPPVEDAASPDACNNEAGANLSRVLGFSAFDLEERADHAPSPDSPPAARTRSRSRTPTKQPKESRTEASPKHASRRRSSRGVPGNRAEPVSLDTFLEEMGVRFLTNARSNKRKSSISGLAGSRPVAAELTDFDRLKEVGNPCPQFRSPAPRHCLHISR
jgi:hypothetical protein